VSAFYAARAAGALRPTRRARNYSCGAERSHEKTIHRRDAEGAKTNNSLCGFSLRTLRLCGEDFSLVPAFYAARAWGAPRPVTRRARNCSCGVERSHEKHCAPRAERGTTHAARSARTRKQFSLRTLRTLRLCGVLEVRVIRDWGIKRLQHLKQSCCFIERLLVFSGQHRIRDDAAARPKTQAVLSIHQAADRNIGV